MKNSQPPAVLQFDWLAEDRLTAVVQHSGQTFRRFISTDNRIHTRTNRKKN